MKERFKGRREDLRLVTGQGRYTADWTFSGTVYGYFLRADHAHADTPKRAAASTLYLQEFIVGKWWAHQGSNLGPAD
jgi:hypothetical protein